MASSLISGAVSIILILMAGYVIATGILTLAETTIYTQSGMASIQESIKQTDISMDSTYSGTILSLYVYNNGSTSFSSKDFEKMDLYVYPEVGGKIRYTQTDCNDDFKVTDDVGKEEYWDKINIGMWDPSEALEISMTFALKPDIVKFVTSNGVSAYSSVAAV